MRRRADSARQVLGRHPWAIGMMESRTAMGPAAMRYIDAVIGSLRAGGFSVEMAAHAFLLLDSYLYGFVVQEINFPLGIPEEAGDPAEAILVSLPTDEYPHLTETATEHLAQADHSYADAFEFGLDLILNGLDKHRDG